jgi:hypothetical protein
MAEGPDVAQVTPAVLGKDTTARCCRGVVGGSGDFRPRRPSTGSRERPNSISAAPRSSRRPTALIKDFDDSVRGPAVVFLFDAVIAFVMLLIAIRRGPGLKAS